jgi:hypothetical protein
MIPRTNLCGDNYQIVLLGNWQIYMADSVKKSVSSYIIFNANFASQRVLKEDSTVWLHRARPPQRHICNYLKIKIAISYIICI